MLQTDWRQLRALATPPQWLRDGKFGIYTHWGLYSLHELPGGGCWYPRQVHYPGSREHHHHCKRWGDLATQFAYHDFIPLFTAPKFDADEWAEIFASSGAVFAGPVAEHHDGFSMWDSRYNRFNAAQMGPKRDIVAALETAIRAKGLKFMAALHHAENWHFYPRWNKQFPQLQDPQYQEFYGPAHDFDHPDDFNEGDWAKLEPMTPAALATWLGKTNEVVDRFHPDLLWFDFGLHYVREDKLRAMVAHYYDQAKARGQEVALTYKNNDLVVSSGTIDVELGGRAEQQRIDWLTDTTVEIQRSKEDPQVGWSYVPGYVYKTPAEIVHNLVDNISKNGYLLLNVGPAPDGTIPDAVKTLLRGVGAWLRTHGEAVYGTTPWRYYGEGQSNVKEGMFGELNHTQSYTAEDIRYTAKGDDIYAFAYVWAEEYNLTKLYSLFPDEVRAVHLLGDDTPLRFAQTHEGLRIFTQGAKFDASNPMHVFKIQRAYA